MARTESAMLELGTQAPSFVLEEVVTSRQVGLDEARGELGLLVMFICRHCPFVVHVEKELAGIGKDFVGKGIGIVAISSNDAVHYPDDAPAGLKEQATRLSFNFPYLYDETQEVARAYDAMCTPDFFLFDEALKLVYRGQLDDSRPGNGIPVDGRDLRAAMNALLYGSVISAEQRPSIGCGIKWRKA